MSSRVFKKLTSSNDSEESIDKENAKNWTPKAKKSIFSMVELSNCNPQCSDPESTHDDLPQRSQKSKRKKNRRGAAKSKVIEITDDDVLLQAAEQKNTNPESADIEASVLSLRSNEILTVNKKFLDYRAELQRKFGSSVTGSSRTRSSLPFGQLVRPKATWPLLVKCGLEMKQYDNPDGDCLFAFTHNKDYSKHQRAFYALQDVADPNTLSLVLSKAPYHVDTLLQLSNYLMHQDESDVAVDLLERALYVFQSVFHLSFNFSTASCRMDYRVQENRSLFIAIFLYLFYAASRSCYRAAFEYSKALLLLDPEDDPLAIILAFDFLAISTEEYEYFISFYETWNPRRCLYLLPNFALSMPLVRWLQRNRPRKRKVSGDLLDAEEIDEMLQDALIMFPGFLPRLMKHVKIGGTDNLDKSVLFGNTVGLTESEGLGRLLDLYVSQSRYHWEQSDVLAWLEANVVAVLGLVEPTVVDTADASVSYRVAQPDERLKSYSERRKRLYTQPPRNVLRHIFLRELPDVPPLVPQAFAAHHVYPLDPFPPADAINTYDPEAERRHREHTEGGVMSFLNALFSTMWPTVPSVENNAAGLNAILAQFGLAAVVEDENTQAEGDGNIYDMPWLEEFD